MWLPCMETWGSGKDAPVKGLCRALGIPAERVSSPTFTLVNVYDGTASPVYHLDAYRIQHLDEFYELGYEDYFFGDGVVSAGVAGAGRAPAARRRRMPPADPPRWGPAKNRSA